MTTTAPTLNGGRVRIDQIAAVMKPHRVETWMGEPTEDWQISAQLVGGVSTVHLGPFSEHEAIAWVDRYFGDGDQVTDAELQLLTIREALAAWIRGARVRCSMDLDTTWQDELAEATRIVDVIVNGRSSWSAMPHLMVAPTRWERWLYRQVSPYARVGNRADRVVRWLENRRGRA